MLYTVIKLMGKLIYVVNGLQMVFVLVKARSIMIYSNKINVAFVLQIMKRHQTKFIVLVSLFFVGANRWRMG